MDFENKTAATIVYVIQMVFTSFKTTTHKLATLFGV